MQLWLLLQSGGCRLESRPSILHIQVYSAFHPSGVGKWVPAIAGKAKAGMALSDCGWTCGFALLQVKLWNPLRTRAIPDCFCGGDSLRRGAISMYAPLPFAVLNWLTHAQTVWRRDTKITINKLCNTANKWHLLNVGDTVTSFFLN